MRKKFKIIHWVIINQLVFILLLLIMSIISLRNLKKINLTVSYIQNLNSNVLETERSLMASILDEESFQKKFQVLRDPDFERLYLKSRDRVEKLLVKLSEILREEKEKELLADIVKQHEVYTKTVSKDLNAEKKGNNQENSTKQSGKIIHNISKSLEQLVATTEYRIRGDIDRIGELTTRFHKITVFLLATVLFIGIALSIYIYVQLHPPIQSLIKGTRAIAEGNFKHRVDVIKANELGELALAFNSMCNRLQELDKLKAEFVANVSHAFKTPLTTVQEAARLLLDGAAGEITEKQKKLLNIIESDNRNLIRLINEVLQISRFESQIEEMKHESFDFRSLIGESVGKFEILAQKRGIKIEENYPSGNPVYVGDRDKLLQVMDNLIENALKYADDGGVVTVSVKTIDNHSHDFVVPRNFSFNTGRQYMVVEVFNTGKILDKDELNYIFEKFYQGKQKAKLKGARGSGLGLYLSRYFVEKHNGAIWAEPVKHKGNIFRIVLPSGQKRG